MQGAMVLYALRTYMHPTGCKVTWHPPIVHSCAGSLTIMDIEGLRSWWHGICTRCGMSEREIARKAGMEPWEVRGAVLPRKNTDVENAILDRAQRIAATLPERERSGILKLMAAARAGSMGSVIIELKQRLDESEARCRALEDSADDPTDHTPMTARHPR